MGGGLAFHTSLNFLERQEPCRSLASPQNTRHASARDKIAGLSLEGLKDPIHTWAAVPPQNSSKYRIVQAVHPASGASCPPLGGNEWPISSGAADKAVRVWTFRARAQEGRRIDSLQAHQFHHVCQSHTATEDLEAPCPR
jgi:hypothetical protein